jgi:metallo-beta-lactamase class B
MSRAAVVISSLLVTLLGTAVKTQGPAGSESDTHVAAARAAAGQDYRATFVNLCLPTAPPTGRAGGGGAVTGAPQTPDRANWYAAPEPEIIEGLTKLGLNPRDIKYVVISHAHGDHDQGAAELQKRYGAQVVMGAPDWEATSKRPATAAGGVPKRDLAVGPEGTKLTLGDTTIQIVATPGHTPGTLSYVFPVKDQGRTVMVAYSGGTLTGAFGADARRWDEYIASQRRIAKVAAEVEARVMLSNHSEYDGAYTKARLIAAPRQPGENHPFIVGTDAVQRYFTVMAECALASKLRAGAK